MTENHQSSQPTIVDTTESPCATLAPVPLNAVHLSDGFWATRRKMTLETTIPTQFEQLEVTGRFDNFRRAAGALAGDFQGLAFNDSDVYKWLEAAAWALATGENATLRAMVDTAIALIAEAQDPDGYLNTYFVGDREAERWQNLRDQHELYCAGHLFQAAVAHYRATGEQRMLSIARRLADLICETFGPHEGQRPGVPGHPEVEMGLVELARASGETRYRDQATYFLDARGGGLIGGQAYHQDHTPFVALDRLTGHAVRALYLSAGAADLLAECGKPTLSEALTRLWDQMCARQLYVTGGLGGRHHGEAIGADYELPNARAYAETCAGIANVMWAWRMLQLDGKATYADLMERALYNAVLPGISLDGSAYFYVNPLANDGEPEPGEGPYRRQPWFRCACCPPNIARVLTQLPGYLYGISEDTIWVHHFAATEAEIRLADGRLIKLIQRTRYPWSGQVIIDVLSPGEFTLNIRIPSWCETKNEALQPTVSVNNGGCPGDVTPGSYTRLQRIWAVGDTVCVTLPMGVRRITAHPYVLENTGRVALMRGPLLYCLEQSDHPGVDLRDIVLPPEEELTSHFETALLGGVEVIQGEGTVATPASEWETRLYLDERNPPSAIHTPVTIRAIPYYAWANREAGAMQVWLRRD